MGIGWRLAMGIRMISALGRTTPPPSPSLKGRGNNGTAKGGRGTPAVHGRRAFAALCCVAVFFALNCGAAEVKEARPLAVLLGELDSDDFETREKAERELTKAGGSALPVLNAALEKSESLELKTRLGRIIPLLKLEAESDPDKLMALSAEAAGKAQFAIAAKGYALVELRCKGLSQKTKSTSEFADLRVKEMDAARRMRLAGLAAHVDKRVAAALAAVYSKLKTQPPPIDGGKDIGLEINDVSDIVLSPKTGGLDELIKAIVAVGAAGSSENTVEDVNEKFVIMTTAEIHEFLHIFLNEARQRIKESEKR